MIPEQFQFCVVGPENFTGRADLVNALGGVVQKIAELFFDLLTLRDFRFEARRSLFEQSQLACGAFSRLFDEEGLRRVNVRVTLTNLDKRFGVLGGRKTLNGISTKQSEGIIALEIVPKALQLDRAFTIIVAPE